MKDTLREIKFRAWDKQSKKMAEELPHFHDICSIDIALRLTLESNFILMQYTGLTDKNGKEIYEGDIVNHPYLDSLSAVEWSDKEAGFHAGGTMLIDSEKEREIIGNIYENPELLK